jgi:PAS fold
MVSHMVTLLCLCASVVAAIVIAAELFLLQRHRRLLFLDQPHRRFLAGYVRSWKRRDTPAAPPQPAVIVADQSPTPEIPHPARVPLRPRQAEGVVYIDAQGWCTFANRAAHELLRWKAGTIALSHVLRGGEQEFAALLESLRGQGTIEQHATAFGVEAPIPVEISGVALRDRDDNLWGAALFIHRPPASSSEDAPGAPSPHRSSTGSPPAASAAP